MCNGPQCHSTARTRMSFGITQFYLPPDRCKVPAITPAEATGMILVLTASNLIQFEAVDRKRLVASYQSVCPREIWWSYVSSFDSCGQLILWRRNDKRPITNRAGNIKRKRYGKCWWRWWKPALPLSLNNALSLLFASSNDGPLIENYCWNFHWSLSENRFI